ncbi:MAG: AAA family ATPase, partial [Acidimicrobiales bacterium]
MIEPVKSMVGGLDWPLVGRDGVLHTIHETMLTSRGVVLEGRAGIGKSRLLSRLRNTLHDSDHDVVEITGVQAAAEIPLAPLLGLVDLNEHGDLTRLILNEFVRRAVDRPVALLIDDAHLLDQPSAAVVHRLASIGATLVVVARRTGEYCAPALEALWKDEHLERLTIDPLSQAAQRRLVDEVVGPVDDETHNWLWQLAVGFPLYVRELLIDADHGRRIHAGNPGNIERPDRLPGSIHELIGRRLSSLEPGAKWLLEQVVACREVPRSVLHLVAPPDALAQLLEVSVVTVVDDAVVPAHPLIGEAISETIEPARRRALAVDLAAALDGLTTASVGRRVAATLLRLNAGVDEDVARLTEAAQWALLSRRGDLATRICEAIVSQGSDGVATSEMYARAHALAGDVEASAVWFRRAIDLAATLPTEDSARIRISWLTTT